MSRPTLVERALSPFQRFASQQASSGFLLIIASLLAFAWANSPWSAHYFELWHTKIGFQFGDFAFKKDAHFWLNEGLMSIVFLLVGLEIKRELLVGEISTPRKALMPLFAALGGMVAPALIYFAINAGQPTIRGWGVPTATDIAFALGILALAGNRVPTSLKVLLTAIAIIDDIGAVLLIALFYSGGLNIMALFSALAAWLVMVGLNAMGSRNLLTYTLLFVGLWYFTLLSGLHTTVAGVLAALAIPASSRIDGPKFLSRARGLLDEFESSAPADRSPMINEEQSSALQVLETNLESVNSPMLRMTHILHPWVAYLMLPLFAFGNSGVTLSPGGQYDFRIILGVFFGLVFGKLIGILLFSLFAQKLKVAELPEGLNMSHIAGIAALGGIGFTMAIFISGLAFENLIHLESSKLGIFAASIVAAILGSILIRWSTRNSPQPQE